VLYEQKGLGFAGTENECREQNHLRPEGKEGMETNRRGKVWPIHRDRGWHSSVRTKIRRERLGSFSNKRIKETHETKIRKTKGGPVLRYERNTGLERSYLSTSQGTLKRGSKKIWNGRGKAFLKTKEGKAHDGGGEKKGRGKDGPWNKEIEGLPIRNR